MPIFRFSVGPEKGLPSHIVKRGPNYVDVRVLVLYPFHVEADKNGNSCKVTAEMVHKVADTYNDTVKFKWNLMKKAGRDIPVTEVELAQNRVDHSPGARDVTGSVVGKFEIENIENEPHMFSTIRVKGKDNIERVEDGRFSRVSIGFNSEDFSTQEISWVSTGAIPGAGTMAFSENKNPNFSKLEVKNILLSKKAEILDNINKARDDFEIVSKIDWLVAEGKLRPVDKLKIGMQLSSLQDAKSKKVVLEAISANLEKVTKYGVVSRNNHAGDIRMAFFGKTEDSGKEKLTPTQQAAKNFMSVLGGKSSKQFAKEEDEEKEKEMSGKSSKKKKFKKADVEAALKLAGDEKKLNEYLCHFMEEDEEEEEKPKHKKEMGSFEDSDIAKTLKLQLEKNEKALLKFSQLESKMTEAVNYIHEFKEYVEKVGDK
jgi:hypothetical protein